jgi:hypothetical protein
MISLHQEYLLRRSIHITGTDHIPESVHIYIYIYIYLYIYCEGSCSNVFPRGALLHDIPASGVPPEKEQAYSALRSSMLLKRSILLLRKTILHSR